MTWDYLPAPGSESAFIGLGEVLQRFCLFVCFCHYTRKSVLYTSQMSPCVKSAGVSAEHSRLQPALMTQAAATFSLSLDSWPLIQLCSRQQSDLHTKNIRDSFEGNWKSSVSVSSRKKPCSSFQAERTDDTGTAAWEPASALWPSCGAIITHTIDDTPDCGLGDQRQARSESLVGQHQDKAEACWTQPLTETHGQRMSLVG